MFFTLAVRCFLRIIYQTLCNPMDCSPPGSSVHGILQARIMEWGAMPSSRGSSWPRDWTHVSYIIGRFFTIWATKKALYILVGISNEMLCSQCSLSVLYHFALSYSVMFTLTPWLSCSPPGFFTIKSLFVPLWRYFKTIIHSSSKFLPLMSSHGCFWPVLLLWWLPNDALLF